MGYRERNHTGAPRPASVNSLFARSLMAVVGVWCGCPAARADDVTPTKNTLIRFADVHEGAKAITKRDDYIRQMSPFDRQVRLQTDQPVGDQELLAFIAQNVIPWTDDDVQLLTPVLTAMAKKLEPWTLNLPPEVLLVKTTGREEGRAAYCRGAAIVVPENMIGKNTTLLERVLPHEIFHVASSHNRALREALYRVVGFKPCNEVALPEGLQARKLTNPDAPVNDHYITVAIDGRPTELLPVIFSKAEHYDAKRGGTLFSYLEFKLMVLENYNGVRRPALVDGQPTLLNPKSVQGFMDQVGKNTSYLIHPEEVLADNFVFVINERTNLPTQRIVDEMAKVLRGGWR
jgi:hypothetical protein